MILKHNVMILKLIILPHLKLIQKEKRDHLVLIVYVLVQDRTSKDFGEQAANYFRFGYRP